MKSINLVCIAVVSILTLTSCLGDKSANDAAQQAELKKNLKQANQMFLETRHIDIFNPEEISNAPVSLTLTENERANISRTFNAYEIKHNPLIATQIVVPDDYEVINSIIETYSSRASLWLDEDVHEYAFIIPAENYAFNIGEQRYYPSILIAWDGDYPLLAEEGNSDVNNSHTSENDEAMRERYAALFDELLPLMSMPVGDTPLAPPEKQKPCTTPALVDTKATITNAKGRISKYKIHTNNPIPNQKQGDWARVLIISQDGHHTSINGQTMLFYKVEVAEGCDATGKWKVGLKSFDVQFRILVDNNARPLIHRNERSGANKTNGGVEGTLGHETEHGEAVGKSISDMLKYRQTPGHKFKMLIEEMSRQNFASQIQAKKAAAGYQAKIEDIVKMALRAGGTHSPSNQAHAKAVFPRTNTAEKIDHPDQIQLTDRKTETQLKTDIKDLVSTYGYKPLHPAGRFGMLPKPKKTKKKQKK